MADANNDGYLDIVEGIPAYSGSGGACYAFYGSKSLINVTIPDSVTSIDSSAFKDCTSLKTVNYAGSKNDWKKIKIDNRDKGNKPLLEAEIIYGKK